MKLLGLEPSSPMSRLFLYIGFLYFDASLIGCFFEKNWMKSRVKIPRFKGRIFLKIVSLSCSVNL